METYLTIVRLIHIFSAIFWAGSTFFLVGILNPTVQASGPEGGRFMQKLATVGQMSRALGIAAALTVLAGILLYWPITGGLNLAVVFGSRIGLTIGALAGISAGVVGGMVTGRSSGRLAALGQQVAAQGAPPSPAQAAEMAGLQAAISRGSLMTAGLMVIAIFGMAIGR